jgi:hypothetical protein
MFTARCKYVRKHERPWPGNRPKGHKKKKNQYFYNHQGIQMANSASIQLYFVENAGKVSIATKLRIFESMWVQSMEGGTKNNK